MGCACQNSIIMKDNEYKCAMCNNVYNKGWTDEDAEKEFKENFGDSTGETDVVCDDCYKKIMPTIFN